MDGESTMGTTGMAPVADAGGAGPLRNARHEAFCRHYTGDHRRNASASYIAAGYSPKSARERASRLLLTNADVRRRIRELDDEALEAIRLHARDANERLGAIAAAKYTDYLDEDGNVDIQKVMSPELSPAVEYCLPVFYRDGVQTGWRLKLYDPMRALELLGLTAADSQPQGQNTQVLVIKA